MWTPPHVLRLQHLCGVLDCHQKEFLHGAGIRNPGKIYQPSLSLEVRRRILNHARRYCPELSALWLFPPHDVTYAPRPRRGSLREWLLYDGEEGGGLMEEDADRLLCHAQQKVERANALLSSLARAAAPMAHHVSIAADDLVCQPAWLQLVEKEPPRVLLVPQGEEFSLLVQTLADLCPAPPAALADWGPISAGHSLFQPSSRFPSLQALSDPGFQDFLQAFEGHLLREERLTCRVLGELLRRQEKGAGDLADFARLWNSLLAGRWSEAAVEAARWQSRSDSSYFALLHGQALAGLGRWAEAEQQWQQVIQSPPSFGGFPEAYWRLRAQVQQGHLQSDRGHLHEALRTLRNVQAELSQEQSQSMGKPIHRHYQALDWWATREGICFWKNLGALQTAERELTLALDAQAQDPSSPATLRGILLSERADVYRQMDNWSRLRSDLEEALPILEESGDREELAKAYRRWAVLQRETGAWEEAEATFHTALRLLGSAWPEPSSHCTWQEGVVLSSLGTLYTCQRRGEEARRCFQACGEAFADSDYDRALLLDRLGVLYLQEGDGARAVALHQASLQILRRLRLPPGDPLRLREWQVRLHLSESYLAQGHYSEAEGEWRFCEKMGQPMDQLPLCRAQVGLLWARIYHAQGRESDAREALAQADHLLEAALIHPGPVGTVLRQRADYHLFRGDVAMDRGDGPEAAGAYGQALQWAARFAEPFAHQKLDLVLQRLEQQFFAGDPLHSDDNRCQAARSFCEALAASLQESSLAARLASVIRNLTQPGLSLALPHLC